MKNRIFRLFLVLLIVSALIWGNKVALALTETIKRMPQNVPMDEAGYTGLNVSVGSSTISLSKSGSWWNLDYFFKKNLIIKNLSSSTAPYTGLAKVTIDAQSLGLGTTKIQNDFDDLRVIYNIGNTFTEITRTISQAVGETNVLTIAFPLQTAIGSTATDSNYYLYYGNVGASTPTGNAYSINDKTATLICPFMGTTTCVGGQTPTTATGAIRYSNNSAMSFDGKNDGISFSTTGLDLAVSTTIEMWVKHTGGTNLRTLAVRGSQGQTGFWWLYLTNLLVYQYQGPTGYVAVFGPAVSANVWHHIAVVHTIGTGVDFYIDGVKTHYDSTSSYRGSTDSRPIYIGASTGSSINGYLDEFRFSDVARYMTAFTPSTTPFINDSNTKLLYHFDENGDDPRNTGKVIDASGNGNNGTISGAKYVNDSPIKNSSLISHEGIFIEEGTTNLITNPSFENSTFNTNWTPGYMNFNPTLATFTAGMSKRNSAGPFAAGAMVQGNLDSTGTGDDIHFGSSVILNSFTTTLDFNQGSIAFFVTPEWNGNDGLSHTLFSTSSSGGLRIGKNTSNQLYLMIGPSYATTTVDASSWTAGSTYSVVVRWSANKKIDGTNYVSISVNDNHTYGMTNAPVMNSVTNSTSYVGSYYGSGSANAIIEGLTIYRRVLYDGTYGTDVGNGDEINLIYNNGTGKDSTLVTGSWDVVFALPTNATAGVLSSGNGNAWSMPHLSNLLGVSGFMMGTGTSADGWNATASNKLNNTGFESDLTGWSGAQSYALNDEFTDSGPTTLVSGVSTLTNSGVITPNIGSDLWDIPAAEFTSGTYHWVTYDANTITNDTNSLKVTYVNNSNGAYDYLNNSSDLSSDLTLGTWYQYSADVKVQSGNSVNLRVSPESITTIASDAVTETTFTSKVITFKGSANSYASFSNLSTGEIVWIDNTSLKPLALSSLFSTVSENTTNKIVSVGVTLTPGTQAGLVMNLDNASNPGNFVIAYHDGTKVYLDKMVGGTYTTVISAASTYVPGATIKVAKKGNSYSLIYNNAQVGVASTIADAGIVNNTLQGLFSTYSGNSFSNFLITTNLDGTTATDGISTRTVLDTANKLSITNGKLTFNGSKSNYVDPGLWESTSIARSLGKVSVFDFNSAGNGGITRLGLATSIGSNSSEGFHISTDSLQFISNNAAVNTEVGKLASYLTTYPIAFVLRNSGAYTFIKENNVWDMLFFSSSGTAPSYYAFTGNNSGSSGTTIDNIRVPNVSWLPTPLAYDTFATDNAATTENVGPDSQTTPQLNWTGGIRVGGTMSVAPSTGDELVINGGFEGTYVSGIAPSWSANGTSPTLSEENTIVHGGISSQKVVTTGSAQGVTRSPPALNIGNWYTAEAYFYSTEGLNSYFQLFDKTNIWGKQFSTIANTWVKAFLTFKASNIGTGGGYFRTIVDTAVGKTAYFDDVSLKSFNLPSLFSTVSSSDANVIADVGISMVPGTQAGLVLGLDNNTSPNNFVIVYHNGSQLLVDEVINGVYTNKQTTTVTLGAGQLRAIKDGNKLRVYLNNALVGSELTMTANNYTNHGVFSTYAGNTFDNFSLFSRSGYDVPAEELTASRDTVIKYSGVASAKLISGGNAANYVQSINVGDTANYNFVTYAYKGVGQTISTDDISLYYNGQVNTTITSVGSDWYKLSGTVTAANTAVDVGVRVKANKTIYVDGFDLTVIDGAIVTALVPTDQKVFAGGYSVNSQQWAGIYKDIGVTAGADVVIRGVVHSDGVAQPQLILYDQSNGNEIGSLYGSRTSTKDHPDNLLFSGEAPTGCTTIRVKLVNASATAGTSYWHQVEVYGNLIDNPSLESGVVADPYIPRSWSNLSLAAGDDEQELSITHSGGKSVQYNSGAASNKSMRTSHSNVTSGKFVSLGAWNYGNGSLGTKLVGESGQWALQSTSATNPTLTSGAASWSQITSVIRRTGAASLDIFLNGNGVGPIYFDDIYMVGMDDVSLTVTPATQVNSTESTGIRVDGADTLTQPITGLSATSGVIKFKFTPRHSFGTVSSFGYMTPQLIGIDGGASNGLSIYKSGTSLRLRGTFNSTIVDADWVNPTLNAGATYLLEISYVAGGSLVLKIDGTVVSSATGVMNFSTIPTTIYYGTTSAALPVYDATFSSFVTASTTENTTAPYFKYGSKSAKIDNSLNSLSDEYVTNINVGSTGSYTLSAYVYDATTGNVGGDVGSSQAQLYYANVGQTTAYTDAGGGWWRLTSTVTGIADTRAAGVQVKVGKIIYVDGIQMEQKAFATTYADGSLGTGYSWSGSANNSSSTRTMVNMKYSASNLFGIGSGSVSFWYKPNTTNGNRHLFINDAVSGSNWRINANSNSILLYVTDVGASSLGYAQKNVAWVVGNWYHIVATWDNTNQQLKMCVNSSCTTGATAGTYAPLSSTFSLTLNLSSYENDSVMSDFRAFDQPLSGAEVETLYQEGMQAHSLDVEKVDRYNNSGSYTSPIIDLGANGAWSETLPWQATTEDRGGSVNFFARSVGNTGNTWSEWIPVANIGSSLPALRYFQWKADIASNSDKSESPIISNMTVSYIEDSLAPNNLEAADVTAYSNSVGTTILTSGNWYNFSKPKFSWNEATDVEINGQSASGIESYKVLLTKDIGATPMDNLSSSCFLSTNNINREMVVGDGTIPNCALTDGIYYLRMQVKDNSGNISTPVTLFTYKYDASNPVAPASVSTTTIGFSATNSFTFYWPSAADTGPAGISGYEYKTGEDGSQWTFTTETTVGGIAAYTEGQNVFYVRAKDKAGNYSVATTSMGTASFYFNESAPTAPRNVVISPTSSTDSPSPTNSFTVNWNKPETYAGEIAKYYYCVNCVPSNETMTETSGDETVLRKLVNMPLAIKQGKNTFYIVAEDNNINSVTGRGNVNFEAYATVDFYAATIAPPAPVNLTGADASDRSTNKWRLTLAWDIGTTETGSEDTNHYELFRSVDNLTFERVGTVEGTAYTDGSLLQSKKYYYKVRAVDNAGALSTFSNVVTLSPEGKYNSPPTTGGVPSVTTGSSTATIKWSTSRESYGTVEFGKTSSYGSSSSDTKAVKDHEIKISGLSPGETYHYRVQNLDDSGLVGYERSTAYGVDYSFSTLSSPAISEVTISDIGLDSAIINWSTVSLSSSEIEYGLTTEYGSSLEVATVLGESNHTAKISGLTHSTNYHFKIKGVDSDGNDINSDDYSFETVTFPIVTAYVLKTDQGSGGIVVSVAYSTNVPTTSSVEYQVMKVVDPNKYNNSQLVEMSQKELAAVPVLISGENQEVAKSEMISNHLLKLSNLEDGSIYVIKIKGRDKYGNEIISEPIRYVTGKDTRPPRISNISVETQLSGSGVASNAQILVTWETDEMAKGQVFFGAGVGEEYQSSTAEEQSMSLRHIAVLRDLQPNASYHLRIRSVDETGNEVKSEELLAVTPGQQESALDLVLKNLEDVFGFLKF